MSSQFLQRILQVFLVMGILPPISTSTSIAAQTTAYTEFVKALDIIEQSQLTTFINDLPIEKEEIIKGYNAQARRIENELDKNSPDYQSTINDKNIEVMREILTNTIERYNDQYANYITPESLKKYSARRNGKFVGVGLKFRTITDNYPIVIGALTDGPMANKDILPGDKLLSVDEQTLKALSSKEVVAALKGPKDSTVSIKIERGDSTHDIQVKRASVDLHYSDATLLDSNIGVIKISRFGSKTHTRVEILLKELLDQGAQGFILDLRNNPGGSTRAARAIVSMFSTKEHIYSEQYKNGSTKLLPRHGSHLTHLPLAVLINRKSMSSSEIVAGAIKTYNRGIIVGTQSFGKGLVQKVYRLDAPLGGAVRTTIAMFGTPDHQKIHATGITPDVHVETDSDFMFQRTGSLNISKNAKAFQRTLLEQDVRKKHPQKAEEFIAAKDLQLETAINKLQELAGDI